MSVIDIPAWVAQEDPPSRQLFRKAVHLVLKSISQSADLAPIMVMKGGILLAIGYHSSRFTTDIDFSTTRPCDETFVKELLEKLSSALSSVATDNEYGLALQLQSHALKPPSNPASRPEVSFPTLQIRVGYALLGQRAQLQKLARNESAQTVQIDYSFNEWASGIDYVRLDNGNLAVYGLDDVIAEKLRSVLQQPIRKRARYQDIYDLDLLISQENLGSNNRERILEKLLLASKGRIETIGRDSMKSDAIRSWSEKDYGQLNALLETAPPPFDHAYSTVQRFYESLPWHTV